MHMPNVDAGAQVSGALRYAINEVNNRKDLLPGYKMDFIFANECGDELQGEHGCCTTCARTQQHMLPWTCGVRDVTCSLDPKCSV